jgi:hypothetical protein
LLEQGTSLALFFDASFFDASPMPENLRATFFNDASLLQ